MDNDAEHRIVGTVGADDIPVMTEWMDIPKGEARGVAIGLEMYRWEGIEIESREGGNE